MGFNMFWVGNSSKKAPQPQFWVGFLLFLKGGSLQPKITVLPLKTPRKIQKENSKRGTKPGASSYIFFLRLPFIRRSFLFSQAIMPLKSKQSRANESNGKNTQFKRRRQSDDAAFWWFIDDSKVTAEMLIRENASDLWKIRPITKPENMSSCVCWFVDDPTSMFDPKADEMNQRFVEITISRSGTEYWDELAQDDDEDDLDMNMLSQGQTVAQPMQTPDGVQKGVKTILQERGKFKNAQGHDLRLICQTCKTKKGAELEAFRAECSWVSKQCCATRVLSEEPDFAVQKEYLAEQVEQYQDCSIIFYPKYHCELNFIEMVWGWTKNYHRRNCTYNFKDLQRELPITYTDRLPLEFVQRAFTYCLRFMNGYREGLVGPELDYAVKKYKGHRCIPVGQKELIKKEFAVKCGKNSKSNGLKRKR